MSKKSITPKDDITAAVPDNMKVFHMVALRIFDQLYEAFPLPIVVIPRSISAECLAPDASSDEAFNSVSIADSTLRWLEAEGFLRHSSSSFEAGIFYQVQLTLKGLAVLDAVSVSSSQDKEPESMIQKIKKVLSAGGGTADEDSIRQVLNELLSMAFVFPEAAKDRKR